MLIVYGCEIMLYILMDFITYQVFTLIKILGLGSAAILGTSGLAYSINFN